MTTNLHRAHNMHVSTEQQQMTAALTPRLVQPLLRSFTEEACANRRMHHHGTKMACHILDAKLEPGKRCSILYKVGEEMVIGEWSWPTHARQAAERASQLPSMQLYRFDQDAGMPALPTVLNGEAMLAIFTQSLPECAAGTTRVLRCRATLLRYRLGKRCTLRYDLHLRHTESGAITKRTLFGKLYHSEEKAEAVYAEMQMLSRALRRPLAEVPATVKQEASAPDKVQKLVVATAAAYIPALPMVLQAPVEDSAPLELLLQQLPSASPDQQRRVIEGIHSAAAALAELHQSNVRTSRTRSVEAELQKLEARSRRIANLDATMGSSAGTELHQLARSLVERRSELTAWGEEITVVHGDCKPSQFFQLADGKMALLDFDHCGMADPASDVGNFLATLRQMAVKQILKQRNPQMVADWHRWLWRLECAFLEAYVATHPAPEDFSKRARWYQAAALLRKALRSFGRSTRSPLPALLVQEAWRF